MGIGYPNLVPCLHSGCCKFVVRKNSLTTMDETNVDELLVAKLTRINHRIVKAVNPNSLQSSPPPLFVEKYTLVPISHYQICYEKRLWTETCEIPSTTITAPPNNIGSPLDTLAAS